MTLNEAFALAERGKSNLTPEYIQKLNGLSSPKIWHLLNILCSHSKTYLEIGTYMGSTLMATLYGNKVKAYAVDNFCMKPTTRNHFFQNVKALDFTFIEKDCFEITNEITEPIQLYFFDGEHSYFSQYRAIHHFMKFMENEFTYVCDDWNNKEVQEGTFDAIKDCNLEVVEFEERKNKLMKDKGGWWCGLAAIKLRKP